MASSSPNKNSCAVGILFCVLSVLAPRVSAAQAAEVSRTWSRSRQAPPRLLGSPSWTWVAVRKADVPARLEILGSGPSAPGGGAAPWQAACDVPCGAWVRSGTLFRVTGDFPPPEPTAVPDLQAVGVSVAPSSHNLRVLGAVLIPTSLVVMAYGALLAVHPFYDSRFDSKDPAKQRDFASDRESQETVGPIIVAVGAAGLIAGGVLLYQHFRTSLDLGTMNPPKNPSSAARPFGLALGRGFSLSGTGLHF